MSDVVLAPPQPSPAPHSRVATRELWLDRLARFPDSGLTPAPFCAIEAVSVPSFYAWKRRLAAQARAAATSPDQVPDRGPRLLPVRLQPPGLAVELLLPTGMLLHLPPGRNPAWVVALSPVNQDWLLQGQPRGRRSMIAPSGQELPLLCLLPTTRPGARTAASSRGTRRPWPTHGSTTSQVGTARA
jgi:hypothetical protein